MVPQILGLEGDLLSCPPPTPAFLSATVKRLGLLFSWGKHASSGEPCSKDWSLLPPPRIWSPDRLFCPKKSSTVGEWFLDTCSKEWGPYPALPSSRRGPQMIHLHSPSPIPPNQKRGRPHPTSSHSLSQLFWVSERQGSTEERKGRCGTQRDDDRLIRLILGGKEGKLGREEIAGLDLE